MQNAYQKFITAIVSIKRLPRAQIESVVESKYLPLQMGTLINFLDPIS